MLWLLLFPQGAQLLSPLARRCALIQFMAYGAMRTIVQAGLSVPQDIAIATFDVYDSTGLLEGQFTYVKQPAFDIGYLAAQTCISQQQSPITNYCKLTLRHRIHP